MKQKTTQKINDNKLVKKKRSFKFPLENADIGEFLDFKQDSFPKFQYCKLESVTESFTEAMWHSKQELISGPQLVIGSFRQTGAVSLRDLQTKRVTLN